MVRILQFKYALKTDGVTSILLDLYENMDSSRIQFDFLVGASEVPAEIRSRIQARGGRIFSIAANCPEKNKMLYAIHKLCFCFRLMKTGRYQAMHVHTEEAGRSAVLFLARLAGIPVRILHAHNSRAQGGKVTEKKQNLWKSLEPLMVTHYLTCSKEAAQWMFPKKVLERGEVVIVNNGIRLEEFRCREAAAQVCRENLLQELAGKGAKLETHVKPENCLKQETPFVLCTVGRLAEQKNYGFLLELMSMICAEELNYAEEQALGAGGQNPQMRRTVLIFLGDGPERAALEAEVKQRGLEQKVFFLGNKTNVKEYLWASDGFLLPSLFEGLPLVLVEAQAAGLPCLVSNHITRQVALTDRITYLPIGEGAAVRWCETVKKWRKNSFRSQAADQVKRAGFDVKDVAAKLQKDYESWV